ncbi:MULTISPECIES: hypothetical protein [Paenibacillus]|uniref:hypothetical protein n=1 Tax=Paenibacillus TaxID=44249 RepID=UPI001356F449|nr:MULTISPECIES: hypothetical protein [Paenibacillus]
MNETGSPAAIGGTSGLISSLNEILLPFSKRGRYVYFALVALLQPSGPAGKIDQRIIRMGQLIDGANVHGFSTPSMLFQHKNNHPYCNQRNNKYLRFCTVSFNLVFEPIFR